MKFKTIFVSSLMLMGSLAYADFAESKKICNKEIRKNNPNLELIKKECLITAKEYEKKDNLSDASWYHLLSGDVDYYIKNIENGSITDKASKIAYAYVLKGDLNKAKNILLSLSKIINQIEQIEGSKKGIRGLDNSIHKKLTNS
jgi:hypothetical protein